MKEENTPLVSVIMSVYNTEEHFLRGAIESILVQTYKNFEFIIVDDASEIRYKDILHSYQDKRIQILQNGRNKGLTESLNRALDVCKGDYIARMDSDDINLPERIERQVKYLEEHRDIDVLACVTCVYDGTDNLRFALETSRIRVPGGYFSCRNFTFFSDVNIFRSLPFSVCIQIAYMDFLHRRNHVKYHPPPCERQDRPSGLRSETRWYPGRAVPPGYSPETTLHRNRGYHRPRQMWLCQ